jgi:glutathione S-transferase
MLFLYHSTTSVCAIKVRLTLDEKQLAYDGKLLNLREGEQHRPDYVKLNPNHVVPTLIHDGKVLIESTVIIEYLDETFPDIPLMPADPFARAKARLWMKKIDDYLHAACSTLTFAITFTPLFRKKTKEELEAYFAAMPNPAYRERQRLSIEQGLDAPHVPAAARGYDQFIGEMEETLAAAPFLAGETYSLADAAATSYVFRAQMLGLDKLWTGHRPRVADWCARIHERPSFARALDNWMNDTDRARYAAIAEDPYIKIGPMLERSGAGA